MQALARFIMRGSSQAALIAVGFAFLSLLFPLLAIPGIAAVALITLRQGPRAGLSVLLIATLAAGLLGLLALGAPGLAAALLLAQWGPAWLLALLLRQTRRLPLALEAAGVLGLLLVLAVHLLVGDPAAQWRELLEPLRQSLVREGGIDESVSLALFAELARWMTGALVSVLILQLLTGLFVARWWQAMLFNPGGFGAEFRDLRLSRLTGMLTLLLLAALGLAPESDLTLALLLVPGPLLLLQGLAVIHALHALRKAHRGWLAGLYVLLVFMMPQTTLAVAGIGLVDIWADFRARAARRLPGRD